MRTGGSRVVEQRVTQAASTMSDPADLINVAIEHLIQQRFELPAFQTLDRLVSHVRHGGPSGPLCADDGRPERCREGPPRCPLARPRRSERFHSDQRHPAPGHAQTLTAVDGAPHVARSASSPRSPSCTTLPTPRCSSLPRKPPPSMWAISARYPSSAPALESAPLFPPSRPSPDARPVSRDAPQAHAAHHQRRQKAAQRAARATSRAGRADAGGLRRGARPDDPHPGRRGRHPGPQRPPSVERRMGAPKRCGNATSRCPPTTIIITGP